MKVTVTAYRRMDERVNGNLRALVSVRLDVSGVVIHDCRVVQVKGQKPYAQPPQKTWVQNGKQCYGGPLIEFSPEHWCAIQRVILFKHGEETGVYYH